jgi:iron complex transport system permease protein
VTITADRRTRRRQPAGVAANNRRRAGWLAGCLVLLAATCVLSLLVGSKPVPPSVVIDALLTPADSPEHFVVRSLRVPRTILGLLVGAALGVSGALIQALTRNPLADPGILGVNAGASFAMVVAVAALGLTSLHQYIWFSFLGAIAATVAVHVIGSSGRSNGSPIRLALAGIALGSVLTGIAGGITLLDPTTFNRMRFWGAGTIADRDPAMVLGIAPFIAAGLLAAVITARSLNAVQLGEELAVTLGARVARTRMGVIVAVTLLCGAATAVAGPIAFVGLMIPHVARWLVGPDQRWILAFTVVLAPVLLLASDILGRVVLSPGELQVGIVTAFIGAPVLIVLVRRHRASGL